MSSTSVAELCLSSNGRVRFVADPQKGVFRINFCDSVVFKFQRSLLQKSNNQLLLVNITGEPVFDIASSATRQHGSTFLVSFPWKPTSPGPYRIHTDDPDDYSQTVVESSIVVNPVPRIPLNQIRMLTVMPRRLGILSDWPSVLANSVTKKNYNAIHFTPMQKLGPSNSSYSIADVLDIDQLLFDSQQDSHSVDVRWKIVSSILRSIPGNPLLFTDIVLNHASSSGSWAVECPEVTYCLSNCGYLRCAAELDNQLAELTREWDKIEKISIHECMHAIRVLLEKFNFSDYFQLNLTGCIDLFRKSTSLVTPSSTDPWWQVLTQIGTCRTQKIIVDFRLFCANEPELWKQIHNFTDRLANLAKECFTESLSALESSLRYNISINQRPLIPRYFSVLVNGDLALNNGWVMNWPAGIDFACPGHHVVYMKRHVVAWGDCLKLRYEDEKIWRVMENYCEKIAKNFDGVRLDNCHSTPLFVLKRLIAVMRKMNPNIIVMAELFTGEAGNDSVFEASIGIDLLVREGMQVHAGEEIAWKLWGVAKESIGGGFRDRMISTDQKNFVPLAPVPATCILYDSTHDNSTIGEKFADWRTVLPLAVLVSMSPSAIGSSLGFDCMSGKMPSVVCEKNLRENTLLGYACNLMEISLQKSAIKFPCSRVEVFGDWDNWERGIKMILQDDRWVLAKEDANNFSLVAGKTQYKFVIDGVHWICSPEIGMNRLNNIHSTPGTINGLKQILNSLHAQLNDVYGEFYAKILSPGLVEIRRMNPNTMESVICIARFANSGETSIVSVELETEFEKIDFALTCKIPQNLQHNTLVSHQLVVLSEDDLLMSLSEDRLQLSLLIPEYSVVVFRTKNFQPQFVPPPVPLDEISNPNDFSHILFRCEAEEPCYEIPGFGKLVYAGLTGISVLVESFASESELLGSAFAENIRTGDWLFDYIANRLVMYPKLHNWLVAIVRPHYVHLPPGLKPKFFIQYIVRILHESVVEKLLCFFNPHNGPLENNSLISALTIATFQFTGKTVAAGLPHFSSGYMRCWGRDTFISFKGLFLVTRRFDDAKRTILEFARVVRHGLIPNLFDDGLNPRYNARDACWFFLNAIFDYIESTGEEDVLNEMVHLRYPESAFTHRVNTVTEISLGEIVEGILLSHYHGIDFVEWNAGPSIDAHMTADGFHVQIFVNKINGLVYGGNQWNCGTWMDKMGSGAGNKGRPATPRWGAAVEINGIALRVLEVFSRGRLGTTPDLVLWYTLLRENFGKSFFAEGVAKDVVGGALVEEERFRPNACIALAIVPEGSVDVEAARAYLEKCEETLRGPLGMRTLPCTDPAYNGVYDNSDESAGYNYHNGPEWVWLFGMFLIACKRFAVFSEGELLEMMEVHERHIRNDSWRSIPELTNINGRYCVYSCPAQAWSVCCLLDALSQLSE